MGKSFNVQERIDGAKELANYAVKRYNEDRPEDVFLFKKERDLDYFEGMHKGNWYCNHTELREMEDYILDNLSKLKLTPKAFCEAIYADKRGYYTTIVNYEDFMNGVQHELGVQNLTRKQKFEGLMRMESNDYSGDIEKALKKEDYFLYVYGLYQEMGGEKHYVIYTVDHTNPKALTYAVSDKESVDTNVSRKHGILTEDVSAFMERLDILNAISAKDVYIVLDESNNESNVLFGKNELYVHLCTRKGVGLKNFRYFWMKMAGETGTENKKGKRFTVGESYIHSVSLEPYTFIGYSEVGELLFTKNGSWSNLAILFLAEDMFDEVEHRIYNLEKNMERMRADTKDLSSKIEKLQDEFTFTMRCYYDGTLAEHKRKVIQVQKDFEEAVNAIYANARAIQRNAIISSASHKVPRNYQFSHFSGDSAIFENVTGYFKGEAITGGRSVAVKWK